MQNVLSWGEAAIERGMTSLQMKLGINEADCDHDGGSGQVLLHTGVLTYSENNQDWYVEK